ncbi:predicted protein, partial [Nematostella vectensis]
AELADNIIRVKAPMLNKIAMAIQLTDGMRAGVVVAKFRRRPGEDAEGHHLYEVGGNIGERCLDNETNMKALYKVNPHAERIIKSRSDYE